ncbi:MAG: RagB/SusD family nutrient uptake outer membrane protein [Candidatus Dadabacteria bacterium]
MKKVYIGIALLLSIGLVSCKKDWLDRQSKTLITDSQVWNDPAQITAYLANLYDRLPTDMGIHDNWRNMADYDDAIWSGYSGEDGRNNIVSYPTSRWQLWDYGFIRDVNLAIENINSQGTSLDASTKKQAIAELRFLRADMYFEMVKRMGGVPIVTHQLIYDFSGDPSPLRQPRNKEVEVYDFIASELDAIMEDLGNVSGSTPSYSRANKYTALALKSRAMLYAASIAKYNNLMASPITTPGGEVGIPAAKANEYYQKSLDASNLIINSGLYQLKSNPTNPAQAFYEAVTKKANNKEVIFVKDFLSSKAKRHWFSYDNIARSLREDNLGSSAVTPTLNLVEAFDYLDGSDGTLKTRNAANTDYIYYNKPEDIFANKDGRLAGTVLYPNSVFKGLTVEMQAGVMVWTGSGYNTVEGSTLGSTYNDGKLLIGASGPHRSIQEVSNTGFYMHKYIDDGPLTSTRGIQSDVWWVWFRLGEIYLNAAEAAFELGQTSTALTMVNKLRERAGFPANSLTTIDINKIRNERRVELAFEDHRVWDLKRWRIADQVWNGNASSPTAVMNALYPYRVINPSDPTKDGKYVFVKLKAPRFLAPRNFQVQNYYSFIPQYVIDNNPLITRNPFQ